MLMTRLSIPGNLCKHCNFSIREDLRCDGCGWLDPVSYTPTKPMINIFLDDIREPEFFNHSPYNDRKWLIVRNYGQFYTAMLRHRGNIDIISFDHDLGGDTCGNPLDYTGIDSEGKTGYDCVTFLESLHCNPAWGVFPLPPHMGCHSANPSGKERINLVIRKLQGKL